MTERFRLATHDTFRSLDNRNFRLFFGGQIVSQAGTWMQSVAIVWVVLELTGSGLALGLVTAAEFLPVLVLGAWAGVVADRVDHHRIRQPVTPRPGRRARARDRGAQRRRAEQCPHDRLAGDRTGHRRSADR